jgi:tetratricopeptide (TPR) repeat protein
MQIAAQGENSTFYYNKGVEFFKANNMLEAENNFKQAVKVNPAYTLGHYGLGRVYILQDGKVKDAVKHLKLSVSLDSDFAKGWFKLGLAELISGKYVDSLHSFGMAYEKDKNIIESLYNIGVVYDLLGDEFKALAYFRLYYKKIKGEKTEIF